MKNSLKNTEYKKIIQFYVIKNFTAMLKLPPIFIT